MTDFKKQLEALISKAAQHNYPVEPYTTYANMVNKIAQFNFEQGCEFLIPVLMKAIEQRDFAYSEYKRILEQNEIKTSDGFRVSFNDNVIAEDSEDLLRILRGEDE